MQWFRLYHEIMDDPKILEMTDFEFRCWMHLLCLASRSTVRGTIANHPSSIAKSMRIRSDRLVKVLHKFSVSESKAGRNSSVAHPLIKITDELITILAWEQRNPKSDNGAARVEKYREGKTVTETLQKRYSNAPNRTEQNRAEENRTEHPPTPQGVAGGGISKNIRKELDGTLFEGLNWQLVDAWKKRGITEHEIAFAINYANMQALAMGEVKNPGALLNKIILDGNWRPYYTEQQNKPHYNSEEEYAELCRREQKECRELQARNKARADERDRQEREKAHA